MIDIHAPTRTKESCILWDFTILPLSHGAVVHAFLFLNLINPIICMFCTWYRYLIAILEVKWNRGFQSWVVYHNTVRTLEKVIMINMIPQDWLFYSSVVIYKFSFVVFILTFRAPVPYLVICDCPSIWFPVQV